MKFRLRSLVLPTLACFAWVAAVSASEQPKVKTRLVSFNRDVRPILSEHCFKCHGPAAKEGKGDLRLDDAANALRDRGGYAAVVPGDPAKSKLLERVTAADPSDAMPPSDSGMSRLTPDQIETLKLWIEQGAKYEKHWAFIEPKMPALPTVKDKSWPKNPIDFFVLHKLEANNLKPEPEADKPILLRRASLTLTGLPPTPDELKAFLVDKSPKAYEKAVDRLLASQRYGEHQARFWLDAVRYGDTHGLHLDNERAIYPYRDWVVRAFNEDLSYDKFALWQLAGDLLPEPTTEQLIATGYVRMNPTTNEGGAIADEFQAKNTFDRVDTTSTVFLGMTIACARCHSHKYDPISHEDYYRLFAFFNSTVDDPLDGNLLTPGPVTKAFNPEESQKVKGLESILKSLESKVDIKKAETWITERRTVLPTLGKWEVSDASSVADFDVAFEQESTPASWASIDLKPDVDSAFLTKVNAYVYLRNTLTMEQDQDVEVRLASDDGIKVWVNGALVHSNKVLRGLAQGVDNVRLPLKKGDNQLLIKIVNSGGPGGVRYSLGGDADRLINEVAKSRDPKRLRPLYLEYGPPTTGAKKYRDTKTSIQDFVQSVPETLIAAELPQPRPSYVLRRGEYNLPTDKVEREIPAALGSLPKGAPINRLGFAEWLTAPSNPLFARVFVNRVWQQHFGTGLVKTAEDFGNQGEWPSDPELLDFLAARFAKDGFSIKRLHRLMVTSAAFRQSAVVSRAKLEADPENRMVSRGPRFRLDAEVLRDQALFASGLLLEKEGGKGFKPYQPAGLWEEVAFQDSSTARYTQDTTAEIYRRSLYLFWKRTSPHPVMMTFDAPMRETCVVRRARTNTPLQALVTMNEPAFLEAARSFAQRLLKQPGQPSERIGTAFRLALGRDPKPEELKIFAEAYERYRIRFETDPVTAMQLVSVGMAPIDPSLNKSELAAWTMVCSTLFNLDEFLTQH